MFIRGVRLDAVELVGDTEREMRGRVVDQLRLVRTRRRLFRELPRVQRERVPRRSRD
jgi:hypothetical protein